MSTSGKIYLKDGSAYTLQEKDLLPARANKVIPNICCQRPTQALLQKWLRGKT